MTPARGILIAALTAILGAAAPAVASAGLSPARTLSGSGSAEEPGVAVGAAGRTLVVWNRQGTALNIPKGHIEARLGRTSGDWGPIQTLATTGSSPLAAVGSDSVAAVAWQTVEGNRQSTLYVSIARADHNFGKPIGVAHGVGLSTPAGLEVQPDGRVVVVWSRGIRTPATAGRSENIDFALVGSVTRTVQTGSLGTAGNGIPTAAETASGTVLVASPTVLGTPGAGASAGLQQGQVAALATGAAAFAAPAEIYAASGADAEADGVGVFAGTGGAAVAFSGEGIQPNTLEISPLLPSGEFGPAVPAAAIDLSSGVVSYEGPVAALPGDGAQVIAYTLQQLYDATGGPVSGQIMASVRPAEAAAFGTPARLSIPGGLASAPVTASAGGSTVVLWGQSSGCKQRVYAAVRPAAGVFAPASGLAPSFTTQGILCGHANNTQLSIDGSAGHLIVGWLQGRKLDVASLKAP